MTFCIAAVFLLVVGVAAVYLVTQLNATLTEITWYNFQSEQLHAATSALHAEPTNRTKHQAWLSDLGKMTRDPAERDLIAVASSRLSQSQFIAMWAALDELAARYQRSMTSAHERLIAIHRRAVIGTIVALMDSIILLIVLMYFVRAWLLRPLVALGGQTAPVLAGNLPDRISAGPGAEFVAVTEPLNKLLAVARQSQERVGKTERFAAVGEASSLVVATLTRPLASVRKLAEYELTARRDDADVRAAFEYIVRTVDTLERWVREMVHSTRPMEFRAKKQSLEPVVYDALTLLKPVATERKVRVEFESEDGAPLVQVDPPMFQQAIVAIIANAIDASAEEGRVAVRLAGGTDRRAALTVRDDGEGMTADIQAKAFNPFFTTRQDRVGLGLTTAHRIVALHGGSIHIESEPDKGTTVKIELPAA